MQGRLLSTEGMMIKRDGGDGSPVLAVDTKGSHEPKHEHLS